eukprot:3108526-Karenia_brevis.AAC.1
MDDDSSVKFFKVENLRPAGICDVDVDDAMIEAFMQSMSSDSTAYGVPMQSASLVESRSKMTLAQNG